MPGTCYVSWLIINCVLKTFVINKQVNIFIKFYPQDVCKRFAYGQYTNCFPDRPNVPEGYTYDSVIAIPSRNNSKCKVFWLLCHDPNELK